MITNLQIKQSDIVNHLQMEQNHNTEIEGCCVCIHCNERMNPDNNCFAKDGELSFGFCNYARNPEYKVVRK